MAGLNLPAATPYSFDQITADQPIIQGLAVVVGWAIEEATGAAAASVVLRDGTGANGQVVIPITLVANESVREPAPGGGILFERGAFLDVRSGTVSGSILVVPAMRIRTDTGTAVVAQVESGVIAALWEVDR